MIPFSRRELTRAWDGAACAAQVCPRSNAHRLLLFYAVECGLKAAYLKRQNMDVWDGSLLDSKTGRPFMHDVNGILDECKAGLTLPKHLELSPLTVKNSGQSVPRHCGAGDLNQVWRYGGHLQKPTDTDVEILLFAIHKWITKELQ